MQKYFIDTCIWRDFYENRFSPSGRNLGKYATNIFIKIIKRKDKILFSEGLIKELKGFYPIQEINNMLQLLSLNNILQKVEVTSNEFKEAKILSEKRKIPFIDCLTAVQSRNHNAIAISQDKHFLIDLADISKVKRPQDIN